MFAGKKDLETWIKIVMPVINKTKNSIISFRRWTLEERNALADDYVFILLFPRKSKTNGGWLYYNINDPNECKEMDKEHARRILIREKKKKQMEEEKISEILAMNPSKEREGKLALISDMD